jgi:hypothetical protein
MQNSLQILSWLFVVGLCGLSDTTFGQSMKAEKQIKTILREAEKTYYVKSYENYLALYQKALTLSDSARLPAWTLPPQSGSLGNPMKLFRLFIKPNAITSNLTTALFTAGS